MLRIFGGKDFIKKFFKVAFPVMIQSMMGFLVSLIDTVMVGALSNEAVAGVYATNQITFFFMVTIGGVIAGAGVYIQQFYGAKKEDYITQSHRFKLIATLVYIALIMVLSFIFGTQIVKFYARNDSNPNLILEQARFYMPIIIISFLPLGLTTAINSSMREIGEAKKVLISSSISVAVNIIGNAIFIYAFHMGVKGVAFATLISRFVELFIIIYLAEKHDFYKMKTIFKGFHIEGKLAKKIGIKSIPMYFNELSWATAMILISFAYSYRPNIISSLAIINSITNIFGFIFGGLGIGVSILVGAKLGEGNIEEAKQNQRYLLRIGIAISIIMGLFMIAFSPFIPKLFTEVPPAQQALATTLIQIYSAFLFVYSIAFTNYITLRTGGRSVLAFLVDGAFIWVFAVTSSLLLAKYTDVSAVYIYLVVQLVDLLKAIVGLPIVLKGVWAKNLTHEFDNQPVNVTSS